MNAYNALGEEPVGKLLIRYATPSIISMLVNAAYTFVDRLFIGNIEGVGGMAITGVGVTVPISTIILAFSLLISVGASTNMSLRMGEGRVYEASRMVGNAITMALFVGAMLTVGYNLFEERLLRVFGASDESIFYAKEYMGILANLGTIPWLLTMSIGFTMRADGSPRRAAIIMIISAVLNIPLDALFIFGLDMGIKGAGLATALSEIVAMIISLEYYLMRRSNLKFEYSQLIPDPKTLKMIVSIGLTPFIIQISMSISQAVINNSLKSYGGDLAIGAMTTIATIVMIFLMPLFGLAQGMQPIVGYNYGARKLDRAKKALMLTTVCGTAMLIVGAFFTLVIPEQLVWIFNKDTTLLAITVDGIRKVTCMLPLVAIVIVGPNYILSIGKARLSMVLSLLRQILVLIPAILIMPRFLGLDGVWFAMPVGDVVAMIVIVLVIYRELRSYGKIAQEKG